MISLVVFKGNKISFDRPSGQPYRVCRDRLVPPPCTASKHRRTMPSLLELLAELCTSVVNHDEAEIALSDLTYT
jgi:hypothetical protein